MSTSAILEVLAGNGSKDVQHHRVDHGEHPGGEIVCLLFGQHPVCGQVECEDTHLATVNLRPRLLPVGGGETTEAVDLLDEKNIARSAVFQEMKKFRSVKLGAAINRLPSTKRANVETIGNSGALPAITPSAPSAVPNETHSEIDD